MHFLVTSEFVSAFTSSPFSTCEGTSGTNARPWVNKFGPKNDINADCPEQGFWREVTNADGSKKAMFVVCRMEDNRYLSGTLFNGLPGPSNYTLVNLPVVVRRENGEETVVNLSTSEGGFKAGCLAVHSGLIPTGKAFLPALGAEDLPFHQELKRKPMVPGGGCVQAIEAMRTAKTVRDVTVCTHHCNVLPTLWDDKSEDVMWAVVATKWSVPEHAQKMDEFLTLLFTVDGKEIIEGVNARTVAENVWVELNEHDKRWAKAITYADAFKIMEEVKFDIPAFLRATEDKGDDLLGHILTDMCCRFVRAGPKAFCELYKQRLVFIEAKQKFCFDVKVGEAAHFFTNAERVEAMKENKSFQADLAKFNLLNENSKAISDILFHEECEQSYAESVRLQTSAESKRLKTDSP